MSEVYDVREHFKSKLHVRMVDSSCQQKPMITFLKRAIIDTPDSVITAEVMFSYFVAEHNLPAAIADHFTDLAPHLFLDSELAKKFRSKRTKTTQIVKCLVPEATKPVIDIQLSQKSSRVINYKIIFITCKLQVMKMILYIF